MVLEGPENHLAGGLEGGTSGKSASEFWKFVSNECITIPRKSRHFLDPPIPPAVGLCQPTRPLRAFGNDAGCNEKG